MPTITAAQHFFSSVPADQSPQKRRGYQTLLVTRGVSSEVVRTIEDRAQYATAPGDPVKRQFYLLPGGQVGISQSVALAELDEFGRRGRYLAHTLILPISGLAPFGHCPLDILAQFPFITTLAAAFQQAKPGSPDVPVATAEIALAWPPAAQRLARSLSPETLTGLGRLSWQAGRLLERREGVALIGSPADQLSVLGLLFLLASSYDRPSLSFDTHAAGCDWGRDVAFWVHGFAEAAEARGPVRVEAAAKTVTSNLAAADDGAFGLWMSREVIPTRLDNTSLANQDRAGRLACVLAGRPLPAGAPLPRDFVERFARLNGPAILAAWSQYLPAGLSSGLTQALTRDLARGPGAALQVLVDGLSAHRLSDFVFAGLLALGETPDKADRQVIEKWSKTVGHAGLAALPALWNKDGKAWGQALQALTISDYDFVLRSLTVWHQLPIPLLGCLLPGREEVWLAACAPALQPADWKKALPVLEKQGAVDQLTNVVARLSEPAQDELRKWVKAYKGEAAGLRAALNLPAAGEKRGPWSLFN